MDTTRFFKTSVQAVFSLLGITALIAGIWLFHSGRSDPHGILVIGAFLSFSIFIGSAGLILMLSTRKFLKITGVFLLALGLAGVAYIMLH